MTHDKFYLPDPLYRILPVIYIVTGILTPFTLSSAMTWFSGLLLIAAGVLVIMWRLSARSRRRKMARRRAERRAAAMDSLSPRISEQGDMRWE